MILCKVKQSCSQTNQKRGKTPINNIWDEEADVPTDANEIQRLPGVYSGNLDSNKLENLGENDKLSISNQTKPRVYKQIDL